MSFHGAVPTTFGERAAPQATALSAYQAWTDTLSQALPPRLFASVTLSVSTRVPDRYDRARHTRFAADHGMTTDEIVAIQRGMAGQVDTLSETEGAAAALARCVVDDHGHGCEPAFARLVRLAGEPRATACLMLAARCLAHATMTNAWELAPPFASPLDANGAKRAQRGGTARPSRGPTR